MRPLTALVMCVLCALLSTIPATAASPVPEELTRSDWRQIRAQIEQDAYAIRPTSADGVWTGVNARHRLRATFEQAGLRLEPLDDAPTWCWTASLASVGRGDRLAGVPHPTAVVDGTRLEYLRGDLTEWYLNDTRGLEQGFVLAAPLPGGRSRELVLQLIVETGLETVHDGTGETVVFRDETGRTAIRYGELRAWDADGRDLPVRVTAVPHPASRTTRIRLHVDDHGATYPVTIDPLITSQISKLTASDGDAGDLFGQDVAVSGDTLLVSSGWDAGGPIGKVYVFQRNVGGIDGWGLVTGIVHPGALVSQRLGPALDLDGDTAAICGAESPSLFSLHIFERNQGGADAWNRVAVQTSTAAGFCRSVAIDGSTVVVGAPPKTTTGGTAFVYERNQGGANAWGQLVQIDNPLTDDYDEFGEAVDIDGDTILIGNSAADIDSDTNPEGAAYVFGRNVGGADAWGQVQRLEASDPRDWSSFGAAVALDGDRSVVGAYDGDWDDPVTPTSSVGAVYLYERNALGAEMWGEVAKLNAPTPAVGAQFGASVAAQGDAVVVGAPGSADGSVYVFARNEGGADAWGVVDTLTGGDTDPSDEFARSIAFDGGLIVAGAPSDDDSGSSSGSAYLFRRAGSTWDQETKVTSYATSEDNSGTCVAQDGDLLVVGVPKYDPAAGQDAGAAFVFERNTGGLDAWNLVATLTASDGAAYDAFGISVDVDGDTVVVGACRCGSIHASGAGAAYVFRRNAGGADSWEQVKILTPSDTATYDSFGGAGCVAVDGDRIAVGAPGMTSNQGAAYLFERNQGGADSWGQVKKLTGASGSNLYLGALDLDGDLVVVGASGESAKTGAAYVFERNSGGADSWGQVARLTRTSGAADDNFGAHVSLDLDTVAISANGAGGGVVTLFERNAGGADAWGEVRQITPSDAGSGDQFGSGVALDRDLLLVGAYQHNVSKGAAYVFERDTGGADQWGELDKIVPTDIGSFDQFGFGVALGPDLATVVSLADDDAGMNAGAVYLFRWTGVATTADLAVTKDDGVTEVTAGGSTTYTMTASNTGPDAVTGATVSDPFPTELSCSWTCVASGGATCTAGPVATDLSDTIDLPVGGAATYTAVCDVDAGASGTIANTVTLTPPGGVTDPTPGDLTATDTDTVVTAEADLAITKDDGAPEAPIGGTVVYAVTVTNAGPLDATGATVTDTFPADLTCSWTCDATGGGSCTAGPTSGDLTDTVDLPAGDSLTYTAICDVSGAASGTLINTATVTPPGGVPDPNLANNSATDTDTLISGLPETLALDGMRIESGVTIEAARSITVTDLVCQAPGGDITFRAGESVIFGDGFLVETGCTVTVEIDPALLP